jgi:DNA adenine methylase
MPTPFLKWVGGKGQLAARLEGLFPAKIRDYIEPFVGGGAVFFWLRTKGLISGAVTLADANEELINAYCAVRDRPEQLMRLLDEHKFHHCKNYYYEVRAREFEPGLAGAARTLYLNKTGFNGLYRVNSKGRFNVPMGSYSNPAIYDPANLRAASEALKGVEIVQRDFRKSLESATRGDFVYLDPPYVPLSSTSSFTSYVSGGFENADQVALAEALTAADQRGVTWALSNSATDVIERLYSRFRLTKLDASRKVNCKGEKRGAVQELVILNYGNAIVKAG